MLRPKAWQHAALEMSSDGFEEYYNSSDLTPFLAQAGQTYWLGLHNGSIDNVDRAEFYWETTGANSSSTGHEDVLPPAGDGRSDNGQQHAFQLTAAVPEPSTYALLALGLGVVGVAARRRRASGARESQPPTQPGGLRAAFSLVRPARARS